MTEPNATFPSSSPTPAHPDQARFAFVPMPDGDGPGITLGTLLKRPGSIIYQLHQAGSWRLLVSLAITVLICLSVHGLIIGSFSGCAGVGDEDGKVALGSVIG